MSSPFDSQRLERLLEVLVEMAGGDFDRRVPISEAHDELDAVAHGVNVLAGELQYATADLRTAKNQAEAASHAKTEFLRNVSHEIRTPVSAMLGIAELLASPDLDPARRDVLRTRILSNGRALLALLDGVLDLSRIETGKLVLELRSLSAWSAVVEVVRNLEAEADRKGLPVVVEPTTDGQDWVLADARSFRQILTNLVSNALKFTDEGKLRIQILKNEPGRIDVDITDTGIGLSPPQVERLFQPFAQADASITRRFGGTGLGLALSRRLARAMGGDVHVLRSVVGEGSTFRLSLPVGPRPAPASRPRASEGKPELARVRLLLAEDHVALLDSTVEFLTMLGADVMGVSNGVAAFEAVSGGTFDVAILDVRMPGLDGLEVTRRLRAGGIRTPIVALTADVVLEHQAECLAAGCDVYLPKPVDMNRLVAVIRQFVPV